MNKVYMTIGLPCTGKTTYATQMKEKYGDKCVVLDSDEIRIELFGEELQTDNAKVFDIMNERTKQALQNGKDVIYCATNLNRKKRIHFINNVCKGYGVIGLFFNIGLGECLENNIIRRYKRNIPTEVLENMYKSCDVPLYLEGFEIIVINNNQHLHFNQNNPIANYLFDYDQNTPYHNETLGNHTLSVYNYIKDNFSNILSDEDNYIMEKVAYFHDLGKPYVRTEITDKKGTRSQYKGHEKVSAYIYSMFIPTGVISRIDDKILTLISYHMGIYQYKDNLNKLKTLIGINNFDLLEKFNMADRYRKEIEE